jgi:hypothetical protein
MVFKYSTSFVNNYYIYPIKYLKQNKTKQNKTKQNKTKQNKTKQNKTKNKTKHKVLFTLNWAVTHDNIYY